MITEEPRRISMPSILNTHITGKNAPSCGTVGCIAGWTCVVADMLKHGHDVHEAGLNVVEKDSITDAANLLELTCEERNKLFFLGCWPEKLVDEYNNAKTNKRQAMITCKRIDLFLKTGGRR